MTVRELRAVLGDFDQDMEVAVACEGRRPVILDPEGLRVITDRPTGEYVLVLQEEV